MFTVYGTNLSCYSIKIVINSLKRRINSYMNQKTLRGNRIQYHDNWVYYHECVLSDSSNLRLVYRVYQSMYNPLITHMCQWVCYSWPSYDLYDTDVTLYPDKSVFLMQFWTCDLKVRQGNIWFATKHYVCKHTNFANNYLWTKFHWFPMIYKLYHKYTASLDGIDCITMMI